MNPTYLPPRSNFFSLHLLTYSFSQTWFQQIFCGLFRWFYPIPYIFIARDNLEQSLDDKTSSPIIEV